MRQHQQNLYENNNHAQTFDISTKSMLEVKYHKNKLVFNKCQVMNVKYIITLTNIYTKIGNSQHKLEIQHLI